MKKIKIDVKQKLEETSITKGERPKWIIAVLVIGLVVAFALAGCASTAGGPDVVVGEPRGENLIVREGDNYIRLGTAPCGPLPSYQTGDAMMQGTAYKLCWKAMERPQPHILIVYEDGDTKRYPPHFFKPESQVQHPNGV